MNYINKMLLILTIFLSVQTNFILSSWFFQELQELDKALTLENIFPQEENQICTLEEPVVKPLIINKEEQHDSVSPIVDGTEGQNAISIKTCEEPQSLKVLHMKKLKDLHDKLINILGQDPVSDKSYDKIYHNYKNLLAYYITFGQTVLANEDMEKLLYNLKLNNSSMNEKKEANCLDQLNEWLVSLEPICRKTPNDTQLAPSNATSSMEEAGVPNTESFGQQIAQVPEEVQEFSELAPEEADEQLEADLLLAKYLEQMDENYFI